MPEPEDERASPIRDLRRIMPLPEADEEELADMELLREIDRKDSEPS